MALLIPSIDLLVEFFSGLPYTRPFTASSSGTVQAMAICLDGDAVGVQKRQIVIN